jgi:hypothetical protein
VGVSRNAKTVAALLATPVIEPAAHAVPSTPAEQERFGQAGERHALLAWNEHRKSFQSFKTHLGGGDTQLKSFVVENSGSLRVGVCG